MRFFCACLVGFCVHYGLGNAITLSGKWHITIALMNLLLGYSVTFILLKYWTFGNPATYKLGRQIWQYVAVSLSFYIANVAALILFVDIIELPYWKMQPIISIALTYGSFSFERRVFT